MNGTDRDIGKKRKVLFKLEIKNQLNSWFFSCSKANQCQSAPNKSRLYTLSNTSSMSSVTRLATITGQGRVGFTSIESAIQAAKHILDKAKQTENDGILKLKSAM